ncbi:hypothetical protein [Brevibacillus fulvus]|uniref:Uncharacterized protein n=1 Tax=Brevibacillus fulvus TaxID=1125967 RepID=A0A939BTJ8_9BACL|nr:hypothetical protein [Brevibacillus fulvus]MBM7588526.1 hypothetical protein [Brevibacillus fulvus]
MLYRYFSIDFDPYVFIFMILPLLAFLLGAVGYFAAKRLWIGPLLAFFLPLLAIASDQTTLVANLDAWLIYGLTDMAFALLSGCSLMLIQKRWKRE